MATSILGCIALAAALLGPLNGAAERSLAAHMVQHMLLIGVAAPLLALSLPALKFPPALAFALHGGAIWFAHAPAMIVWMAASLTAHMAAHAALFGTALLFWSSLLRRAGEAPLWVLATLIHTGILGALLTFAPRELYAGYSLADQQLAGLVMWVPGGFLYLAAGLVFARRAIASRAVRT
ncbi:MAG TPA: cytochrome c oxidase assembly protein [Burkholderiales bacterium]|nr:cytochrome c oxidase assembly protein [Burkholderiales bacterium]